MSVTRFALWFGISAALASACGGITDTMERNAGRARRDGGAGTAGSAGAGGTLGTGGTTGSGGTAGTGGTLGSGGSAGSPPMDASRGDDVMSREDVEVPPVDAGTRDGTILECTMPCTSDSECQAACGPSPTYCCDLPTGACYVTVFPMCPSPVVDSGSDGSIYGAGAH